MQLLIYLIVYPILWLISKLPFRLLYIFSDFVYILIYRVIGFRKKVVRSNLEMALPQLSEKERREIEKKFYHHLCDMFLEMIKTLSISKSEIEKRFVFKNLEVYKDLEKKGKDIALLASHYASYEWVISMNNYIDFKGVGIYKKIANEHFDRLVKNIRLKFKAELVTTKKTKEAIIKNKRDEIRSVYGFASDQTPRLSDRNHWATFMGIKTPIHIGAEVLAKEFDMNVILLTVKKVKRGYYEASFEVLCDTNVRDIPNYEISETFIKRVEEQIYNAPEFYFWVHKRWKHRKD